MLCGATEQALTHYGSTTGLGIHMQVSMEILVIEGGMSFQLLSEPYSLYGERVTHSWLRSVWEKVDMFGFKVELRALPLELPREGGDGWIMRTHRYTEEELLQLNRVRCYQQVLFTSNVFDGRSVDRKYLARRLSGESWSTLIFPQERPPGQDFALWQQAPVLLLTPRGRPDRRLGRMTSKGHKIWEWRYNLETARLFHI
jgi:hypothetical protein